jgi:hypothetical protein
VDEGLTDLQLALAEVRAVVDGARFPLHLDGAPEAREGASALVRQLDDYLAPRARQLDAPLLAVVGGSTGAGKSTLVNSLVRAPVSPAGVLRPTTRSPLLLAHPSDLPWFVRPERLPGLPRGTRSGVDGRSASSRAGVDGRSASSRAGVDGRSASSRAEERTLQVVTAPLLWPGLALIDAPDIDSVVAANRALARELLAAADLWLFVTTAARYADAAPWQALRNARDRGVGVAIVLNRLPPESADRITHHFSRMLAEQSLAGAPLFALRESTLDGHGMVSEREVSPLKKWLDGVAGDTRRRDDLTRRTLLGTLDAAAPRLEALAQAAEDQSAATAELAAVVRSSYATAMSDVQAQVRGGAALRGDVYATWRELVASGELRQAIDEVAGRRRPRPQAEHSIGFGRRFQGAVAAALAGLITEADVLAAQRCQRGWRAHPADADGRSAGSRTDGRSVGARTDGPAASSRAGTDGPSASSRAGTDGPSASSRAGASMLDGDPRLGRPWAGFADAAHDLVHAWQTTLRELAREVSPSESAELLATVASVAPPLDDITGTGIHADALRDALREPGPREVGERMREEFVFRVGDLLAAEVARHVEPVLAAGVDAALPFRLRAASDDLRQARTGVPGPSVRPLGTLDLSTLDKRGYAVSESPAAGVATAPVGVADDAA